MRYLSSLQSQIKPWLDLYIETALDVFSEMQAIWRAINRFLDDRLESDTVSNVVIAVVIATPFIGILLFFGALLLSA